MQSIEGCFHGFPRKRLYADVFCEASSHWAIPYCTCAIQEPHLQSKLYCFGKSRIWILRIILIKCSTFSPPLLWIYFPCIHEVGKKKNKNENLVFKKKKVRTQPPLFPSGLASISHRAICALNSHSQDGPQARRLSSGLSIKPRAQRRSSCFTQMSCTLFTTIRPCPILANALSECEHTCAVSFISLA